MPDRWWENPIQKEPVKKKTHEKGKIDCESWHCFTNLNKLIVAELTKNIQENQKNYFEFPSGLKLKTTKDEVAAKEWYSPGKTPLELFHRKFPDKKLTEIVKSSLRWVQQHYINKVPIVIIEPEDLDRKISKYFRVRELVKIDFTDKEFMQKAGTWKQHQKFMIHDADGKYYWNVARIDPNLCKVLDAIREKVEFPLKINEGVRPYAYNKDMYLARHPRERVIASSPHTSGRAVDMQRTGDPEKDKALITAIWTSLAGKGGGIGYGATVYHVDTKIQHGGGIKGSWIIDEKTGKVKLRTRTWGYRR